MLKTKVGFIVYGVHKDGLQDPLGLPFVDDAIIGASRNALLKSGLELVEHDLVIASKAEAAACLSKFKKMDDVSSVVLISGTWVWSAHLIAAIRDYTMSGKEVVIWTHPGSQGWRPVGGLVMHGALREVGIKHRFVYGPADCSDSVGKIVSYCRGAALKARFNMSTLGVFGGRGMGQTCGVADPAQWMRMFGVDIDSRDCTGLLKTADAVTTDELKAAREKIQPFFSEAIPEGETADKSIRLYLALKKVVAKENWDFYTIQSFPGLGDDYSATCFAQSMMLNDRVGTSTLSDFNTALTSIILNELSDDPPYYGDLQHVDLKTNEIKIIGDGACPPCLAGTAQPAKFAEHGIPTEGEAGGISVELVCKPGPGVLARAGRNNGEFEMVLAKCDVYEPEAAILEQRRRECSLYFWPHAFCTAKCDINQLVSAWNNEYAVLGYGENLYDEISAFCEQTGIKLNAL